MASVDSFIAEWRDDKPYICAHTSGSTGKPKEIRLPKADMLVSARATNEFFDLGSSSVAALPLSTDYIAGKMMIVRALTGDYRVVGLPVSNTIVLPDDGTVYDIMPVVPSQLPSIIARPEYCARIRNLIIGGASPGPDLCRELTRLGYRAYISYGMTETCSHVALADASDPSRVFRALPGVSFSCDADSRLVIEAPHYSFRRLQTNDIVELLSPQEFRWRGRFDNVINSGGIKMYPEELETLYAPFLKDREYYVTGRPDPAWGQAVTLVVEREIDAEALLEKMKGSIDHRRCPKNIEIVAELPRTQNGKIRRL